MPKQKRPWVNAERSPITGDLAVGIAQGKKDEQLGNPHQDPYSQRLIEFNNLITIRMIVREFLIEQFDHSLIEAQQAEQLREEAEEARRARTNSEEERRALQAAADAEREAEQRLLALIREAEAQAELDTLHMLEMLKQILSEIDAKLYQLSHEIHVAATEYYSILADHIDFHRSIYIDLNDYPEAELRPGVSRNIPLKLDFDGADMIREASPLLAAKMREPGFKVEQLPQEEAKELAQIADNKLRDLYARTFAHPERVITPARVKKEVDQFLESLQQTAQQARKVGRVKEAENVLHKKIDQKGVCEEAKKVCEGAMKACGNDKRTAAKINQAVEVNVSKINIGSSKLGLYGNGVGSASSTAQKQQKNDTTPRNKT